MNIDNYEEEIKEELSDLDVDNLIELYKECQQDIERLNKLEEDKIEQVKFNNQKVKLPIENKMKYIEEQLKEVVMNSPDKKQTKTLWKKKFISGEVQIKKSQKKIKNPKLDGKVAYGIEELKDYTEQVVDYRFKWKDLKNVLEIKDNDIINIETGEILTKILEIEEIPEEIIIK